uniref:Progestin and adipoQ receptor family member 6 n=1 Tax=Macaca mulatta TaxID=9544 RepID=A0A5F8AGK0_MACMU
PTSLGAPAKLWVNVEVPGHHAQSQAAPTSSSPPGPPGVLGRWHHVWLPPPHQLGFGLCSQLLPDDQRDGQHLDSLPAHLVRGGSAPGRGLELRGGTQAGRDRPGPRAAAAVAGVHGGLSTRPPQVLPVAAPGAGGRPRLPRGAVPLAAAGLPAARLPLPLRVVLRAHLQLHVAPRAPHLLLPGLRRAQPLQPRLRLPLCRLLHAGLLAARPPAPVLCACRRTQLLLVHRPLLLLPLGLCWGRGHSCGQEVLSTSHGYHLFCALLTGFLFASHLPERLAPGRFDYIGEGTPGPAREEAGADGFLEHRMNWATATSYSTSVQCWAPTSSWRQCWLIWDRAEPGWPHRNLPWAWQAQWPHWSWL